MQLNIEMILPNKTVTLLAGKCKLGILEILTFEVVTSIPCKIETSLLIQLSMCKYVMIVQCAVLDYSMPKF